MYLNELRSYTMSNTRVIDNWEDIANPGGSRNNDSGMRTEFLRMNEGTYRVRPIGSPVAFSKYVVNHNGSWRSAIPEDGDDNPIAQKHDVPLTNRYAIHVFDRQDGKIKVMEAGVTVFSEFKNYYEHTSRSPGGKSGAEFIINVTGRNKKKRYDTKFADKSDLSAEEVDHIKEYISAVGCNTLKEHLLRLFKSTSNAEIEEKLFGDNPQQNTGDDSSSSDQSVDSSSNSSEDIVSSSEDIVSSSDDFTDFAASIGDDIPF